MTFRLSDLLGIGDRYIPALGLVDLAIRERIFDESMDAFSATCPVVASNCEPEGSDLTDAASLREEILVWLQDSLLDGSIEEFIDRYFSELKRSIPDIDALPRTWFRDEVVRLTEYSLVIDICRVPRIAPFSPHDHYRILLRHHAQDLHAAAALLSPIIYWLHHPFLPVDRADDLLRLIASIVDAGASPINESSILTRLKAKDIVVRPRFLRVVLANDARVAVGKAAGKPVVWKMKNLLPNFDLAAYHLDEREYLTIDQWYQLPTDSEAGYLEIRSICVRQEVIRNLLHKHSSSDPTDEIDWVDVAYKLACTRYESYEPMVQCIGGTLHRSIVEQLQRTGRAMQLGDLQKAIGIDFELSPEMIGPAIGNGMIMAYARHTRFLEKDSAYYVLSDNVETDTEKKGRISRDRIVTPSAEKDWAFSSEMFSISVREDPIYRLTRLVMLRRIVTKLSRTLPCKPVEPFFVKKMSDRAKALLNERGVHLGKGAYVLHEDMQNLFGISGVLGEDDTSRMKVIALGLGSPSNLREAVLTISDASIREDLMALI